MDVSEVIAGVLRGEPRAVARAISLVESGAPELAQLSAGVFPHTGNAWSIGLTGSPGVGKSSLAAGLVRAARSREERIAVLAVDPSSPFSGGALLGDRVRMQEHATDPGVFIRSMATRGHLGGMALAAPEAIRILDASGAEQIVVETVGVGQAELEVATATDTTVVVVQPGWGDAVQVAKAGILEIANVFVVNKAELEGANQAVRELESMLRLGGRPPWTPPVVKVSTRTGEGLDELSEAILAHRSHIHATGALARSRALRLRREVEGIAAELLRRGAGRVLDDDPALAEQLEARTIDPYAAAARVISGAAARAGTFEAEGPGATSPDA
ncbi:MAG: methylmalonyl Co-A mutase-associated GTPase MeaB [Actinomycetota bacterium]